MTSDETPVERRLRAMLHGIEYDELIGADPKAIDCGREAMAAICTDCAKTHKVIVVEREAPKEHWPAAPPQEDQ